MLCESEKYIPIASTMIISFIIKNNYNKLADQLEIKLSRVWILAVIILFLLVGAAINLESMSGCFILGTVIVIFGFIGRGVGY